MSEFHGHPTGCLESPFFQVEYLLDAGPRIVRLVPSGTGKNLLAETPDISWQSPSGTFHLYGGHRLWVAPEVPAITSEPDDAAIETFRLADGVRLLQAPGAPSGLRKRIDIHLDPLQPRLTLEHYITNEGPQPVAAAPWAVTVFPMGSTAVLPQLQGPLPANQWLPNRSLVLWPYTCIDDPRLRISDHSVVLSALPSKDTCKVGHFNRPGWVACQVEDFLLVKRFQVQEDTSNPFPDWGCNAEAYTNGLYLELETLAAVRCLQPGETVSHTEIWWVIPAPELASPENIVNDYSSFLAA